MAEPTEPSLAEAIEWGKGFDDGDYQIGSFYALCVPFIHRLVTAGEFEQSHKGTLGWACARVEVAERDRQLQGLRRQLDAVGKEKVEGDRRIEELESKGQLRIEERDYCCAALSDAIKQMGKLRSQLAEKERGLNDKDRRYEKMDEGYSHQIASLSIEIERLRKSDGCKACRVCPYVTDLETADKEQEGLMVLTDEDCDRLNRFNSRIRMLETKMRMIKRRKPGWFKGNPDPKPTEAEKKLLLRLAQPTDFNELARQVKTDIHSDTLLGEKLRGKLWPAPTEAEVEKVAARLHYEGYSKPSKAPTDWEGCAPTTKLRYRRRARHVLERGYRPKEE